MIFYDWKKIYRHSNGSSSKILNIIQYITEKPIPKDQFDLAYKYMQINWKGQSFLYNPEPLLYYRYKYDDIDLAHYVGFASLRNYSEFQILGKLTLDFLAWKGKEDLIKHNSLLRINDNNELVFLYEEAHNKEI